jgi:Zn-dependent protease with chaperone function
MPILLVFALIAACLPIDWPEPPLNPPRETALALTGGAVGFVLLIAFVLRTWVVRTLRRDPGRRIEVARVYGRMRRVLFFLNISTAAGCVLGLGWGWLVQHEAALDWTGRATRLVAAEPNGSDPGPAPVRAVGSELAPFAELAVPLPYFIILVGCWFIYYDAERALHRTLHGPGRPFAPRFAYLLHNARQFALMVMLPVGLVVTQQTLGRFAPETTRSEVYRIASLATVPVLLLFMPLLMKPLLGLKTMPSGPLRARLEAMAERLNFRCTDFLLWPTHGAAANAMIAGLLPRVRYVVFTDRILEELSSDELDAVFGHEVGHAKHGHIWLYAAFLMLSLSVLAALLLFLAQQIDNAQTREWVQFREQLDELKTWMLLPPVVLVACYLFVVFGALSRRCERQADVFGCKAVSCGNPTCTGHDESTVFPQGGKNLCPTGIKTFSRALARVGDLHGVALSRGAEGPSLGRLLRATWAWIRAWQHSPIPRRIAFLSTLLDHPGDERRFQRRLFVFKCALMLALAVALVALGETVGWKKLFDEL